MPLPRREVAVVPRHPGESLLALFRLPGGWGRLHVPDEDRRAQLCRGGRAPRRQVRRPAAARGRRRPRRPPQGPGSRSTRRGPPGGAGVLRRAAVHARCPRGPPVPAGARVRPGGGRPVRDRLCPARRRRPAHPPAAEGLPRRRSGRRRARGDGAVGVRPLPRTTVVADPRRQRRHDRVRCATDLRRRPDRREVPQHPRDPDLQEEPGALRHRPGAARHGPVLTGGRGRGLHRRDGLPPGGSANGGRHLRYGVRRRPRAGPAPVPARPRGLPR